MGAQLTETLLQRLLRQGTRPQFFAYFPAQAVGANKVFFDIWNGAPVDLVLEQLLAIKDGSAAVTGVLAVKLIPTRTTAIGTTGTAAVTESATLTDNVLGALDPAVALPAGVSARAAPGGGATAGTMLGEGQLFTEETTGVSYNDLPLLRAPVVLAAGAGGARVIQGSVASVGNIAFLALFRLKDS